MTESTAKTKSRASAARKPAAKPAAAKAPASKTAAKTAKAAKPATTKAAAATTSTRKTATRKVAVAKAAAAEPAAPQATVQFTEAWTQGIEGELVAGGLLRIEYALARALAHGDHDGATGNWGVDACVQFLPSGETVEAPVVGFPVRFGKPAKSPQSSPVEIAVPHDAYEAQVWFRNWTEGEEPRWDSNFGVNYRYPIKA